MAAQAPADSRAPSLSEMMQQSMAMAQRAGSLSNIQQGETATYCRGQQFQWTCTSVAGDQLSTASATFAVGKAPSLSKVMQQSMAMAQQAGSLSNIQQGEAGIDAHMSSVVSVKES